MRGNPIRIIFRNLPEADRADLEFFLGQLRLVLPTLGFDLFRGPGGRAIGWRSPVHLLDGRRVGDGVLAGSTAGARAPRPFHAAIAHCATSSFRTMPRTLNFYRFAADVAFASPSAAASVVAARSASGLREWKVNGTGQTYRDWRAEQLGDE